ncbi:MAG: hypothetical protein Unbinned4264contig1000_15 [Prokaryotic dsDNA virus sp.]|nr:MAG: hypothetical protein Unbinned4264contig1000_15 [Prokaryotic dsDNA virus sp.]|tara:strand:+ start:2984 stop:3169 length:186 start_codon:yes stop_codon:yes gene_type:complete
MKNNNNRVGRKTKKYYYKPTIIKNGKVVLPEIITEDYGFEMQFGFEEKHITKEEVYLKYKK